MERELKLIEKFTYLADSLPEIFEMIERIERKLDERWIDSTTAAEILGINPQTVIRKINEGKIKGNKKFGTWRLPISELYECEEVKKTAKKKGMTEKELLKQYVLYGNSA